jgi:hypothetical protein
MFHAIDVQIADDGFAISGSLRAPGGSMRPE